MPTRPLVVVNLVPGDSAPTVSACRSRCLRCVRLMNQIIPTIRISGSSSVKPPPPEEAIGTARSCIGSQNPSSIGSTGVVGSARVRRSPRDGLEIRPPGSLTLGGNKYLMTLGHVCVTRYPVSTQCLRSGTRGRSLRPLFGSGRTLSVLVGVEERVRKGRTLRDFQADVPPGRGRGDATTRRTSQIARPDQERFGHFLHSLTFFADRNRQRGKTYRSAPETAAQGVQNRPVQPVQAHLVHLVQLEGRLGQREGDMAVRADPAAAADPSQQRVSDSMLTPGTRGDLGGAF